MSNSLQLKNGETSITAQVSSGNIYSSFVPATYAEKASLVNALSTRQTSLEDIVGTEISITGVIASPATFESEDNDGVVHTTNATKIILLTTDGSMYSGYGSVLKQTVEALIFFMGVPSADNAIPVIVTQTRSQSNASFKYINLQLVTDEK